MSIETVERLLFDRVAVAVATEKLKTDRLSVRLRGSGAQVTTRLSRLGRMPWANHQPRQMFWVRLSSITKSRAPRAEAHPITAPPHASLAPVQSGQMCRTPPGRPDWTGTVCRSD